MQNQTLELEQVELDKIGNTNAEDKADWGGMLPFFLVHVVCLSTFWVGVSWAAFGACLVMLFLRMFALTAGYHRYFSHRTYKTSRAFQFLLALIGTTSGQMGPLWWAAHHRHHHLHADTQEDVHPPTLKGFWWSHMGWVLCKKYYMNYDERSIRDFGRYPELRWLNENALLMPFLLGTVLFIFGQWLEVSAPTLHTNGIQMAVWGFFVSTVFLYHLTFCVNSLAHTVGSRRFETSDTSRNSFLLGLITMGEGWHNNHHRYPSSERQGFHWWEIDLTHYLLKALSWVGVVRELRNPPREINTKSR